MQFLGSFEKLREITISFIMSVHTSACLPFLPACLSCLPAFPACLTFLPACLPYLPACLNACLPA
jgi:hypothetical protein